MPAFPSAERHERARLALELVGLGDKLKHKPMPSSPAASSSGCPSPGRWRGTRR